MKKATQIFMSEKGLGLGQRRITLSTSGLVPAIEKLAIEGSAKVFITDAILSHLMVCPRSVFSWDVIVQKLPDGTLFFDVGVGTGFYSKRMLEKTSMKGVGFDMSPHSIEFTQTLIESHRLNSRYSTRLADICSYKDKEQADVIINVEVLEHLEDPQSFLKCLVAMLKPGGHAFIAAAVNAPNEDHIYLYRSGEEVAKHIEESGLYIIHHSYDYAYDPRRKDELVPVNAVFIAKKGA
jgi:2-polyprenyl-3-methyl-5-hydroxy-6-metoxy-1,4-benzoquinol methylase